jgi:hypothetical protein
MSLILSQPEGIGEFLNPGFRFGVDKIGNRHQVLRVNLSQAINHTREIR